jgi:uncharacterized protein
MNVIGIDLAGPAGAGNTAVARFRATPAELLLLNESCDGTDAELLGLVERLSREATTVVGLDAPLSYEPGGGERRRDAELRRAIVRVGMHPGSVMAPTAPRMVYLTLRGLGLTRQLDLLARAGHEIRIVEVHPGAVLGLRGAPIEAVRTYGADSRAAIVLLDWLRNVGLKDINAPVPCSAHFVAACAAALGAWKWLNAEAVWLAPASKPWHPYDFTC